MGSLTEALPDDWTSWSADETIHALHSGHIKIRDYISNVLDRAKQTSSHNSIITLLRDEALEQASTYDRAIAHGEPLPPLAGLAIVAKDNINMAGLPTSAGTPALRDARPLTTAPSLARLIAAGAIVVAKANMHELAFGVTSTNLSPFAGPVHNPYAPDKISGGSSGGTAVAIADRVVTAGVGTDTAGSTRIPASLSGCVGMRPSIGDGGAQRRYHDKHAVEPISHTRDTIGAMGRTVADVALLDSVIADRPRVHALPSLEGVRLGVAPVLWDGLDDDLRDVVLKAKRRLEEAGAVLVNADVAEMQELSFSLSSPIANYETKLDIPAYLEASGIDDITMHDIVQQIAAPDVRFVLDIVQKSNYTTEYEDAMQVKRPALQRMYADHFAQHRLDALLFPTTILPATPMDKVEGSGSKSINGGPAIPAAFAYGRNSMLSSIAGTPGLSIPAGLTCDGLPVGLEIDGLVGSDEKLLSLGLAMEKVLGQLPPPPTSSGKAIAPA